MLQRDLSAIAELLVVFTIHNSALNPAISGFIAAIITLLPCK